MKTIKNQWHIIIYLLYLKTVYGAGDKICFYLSFDFLLLLHLCTAGHHLYSCRNF